MPKPPKDRKLGDEIFEGMSEEDLKMEKLMASLQGVEFHKARLFTAVSMILCGRYAWWRRNDRAQSR